jgi:hypothetical protein
VSNTAKWRVFVRPADESGHVGFLPDEAWCFDTYDGSGRWVGTSYCDSKADAMSKARVRRKHLRKVAGR